MRDEGKEMFQVLGSRFKVQGSKFRIPVSNSKLAVIGVYRRQK
jgi:hypothetical protein